MFIFDEFKGSDGCFPKKQHFYKHPIAALIYVKAI